MGFAEAAISESRPELSAPAALALRVWHFMGGWKPEALPLAFAYHDVREIELTVELLLALREALEKHAEAQRAAAEKKMKLRHGG